MSSPLQVTGAESRTGCCRCKQKIPLFISASSVRILRFDHARSLDDEERLAAGLRYVLASRSGTPADHGGAEPVISTQFSRWKGDAGGHVFRSGSLSRTNSLNSVMAAQGGGPCRTSAGPEFLGLD